ncbi:hypothetical protein LTR08_001026 [Meristemomyces frigidus]|nr:hypothetical protein LTR08_001026 [Meristemomyces frigidus]
MPAKVDNDDHPCRRLAKLRDLPTTSVLLLLTPVMVPSGFLNYDKRVTKPYEVSKARIEQIDTDPFEPLGRALAKRYHRIRHVPYLPSVGLTSTHEAFITQADGVVVVTSEPEPKAGGRNGDAAAALRDCLENQAEFAESVTDNLWASTGAESDTESVPVVNLHFGLQQRKPAALDAFASVWVADKYTAAAVERIMQLLVDIPE